MADADDERKARWASLYDDIRHAMSWRLGYGAPQGLSPMQLQHVEDATKAAIENGLDDADAGDETGIDLPKLLKDYRALRGA